MTPETTNGHEDCDATTSLGAYLREARLRKLAEDPTYTLRKFAQKLGISSTHLSRVENGEGPASTDVLERFAELLGLDRAKLFELAGRVDPNLKTTIQRPGVLAFLRTIDGASDDTLRAINEFAEKQMKEEKKGE